jgi:hypothetical protein
MRILIISAVLSFATTSSFAAIPVKHSVERTIRMKNFSGKITLTQVEDDKIEVKIRTWRTTRDTVIGHDVFPVLVSGGKQKFFFGHFGASTLPMLIFATSDPERISDTRVLAYQVSPRGSLIGQQVIVDDAIKHGHTDNITSGRYSLTAIDPKIGAIYSIASQDAHFEGFFVSYEKLRVRQWDPAINSFIETDEGFLRDRTGKLMQSTRFDSWSDAERSNVFAANLDPKKSWMIEKKPEVKVMPTSAAK